MSKSIIYAAGLTARTCIEIIKHDHSKNIEDIAGVVDENEHLWNTPFHGVPVIGGTGIMDELIQKYSIEGFHLALGAVKHIYVKESVFNKLSALGLKPMNLISDTNYLALDCTLGDGILMLQGCIIGSGVHVKDNVLIHCLVSILEETVLHENCAVASNTFIGARCSIGRNVYIGPGCTIGSGVSIGNNTIIGAGSTVLKDVPEGVMGFGNPFQINSPNKYLK